MSMVIRILAFIFTLLLMTGFGVCGTLGLIGGVESDEGGWFFIVCGLVGLAIAGVLLIPLLAIIKSGRSSKDDA